MRTSEIREIFAVLAPELRALVAEHATDEDGRVHARAVPDRRPRTRSRASSSRRSARPGTSSGSTRPCIRSRSPSGSATSASRAATRRTTSSRSSPRCTSADTASTSGASSPTLERTPLCAGVSATLHESQSRLWENVVGRSLPFWRWFYPRVQETFPEQLGDVPLESFHRAVNRVRRSFIRVDADETSYGLHVILRFELEQELLSGRLAVADLPDAWNARFEELMGIPVPNDALGVLQDAHWSGGGFGYFPTYLLGTRALRADLGARRARRSRTSRSRSSAASSASSTRGCARTSTRSAASSRLRRRSSASSAARSTRSRTSRTCARSSETRRPPDEGAAALDGDGGPRALAGEYICERFDADRVEQPVGTFAQDARGLARASRLRGTRASR